MQSIFRPASRREALGEHSGGDRRDGGLKMLCIMFYTAKRKSDYYLLSYFACRDALADNRNAEPVPQAFRALVSRNRDR